jgi:hypothetical protein
MTGSETGQVTGTKDKDYNIIWFTEACLSNALRLETYIQDAEREGDTELDTFFRKAQAESRKGAEQGKQLLRKRLGRWPVTCPGEHGEPTWTRRGDKALERWPRVGPAMRSGQRVAVLAAARPGGRPNCPAAPGGRRSNAPCESSRSTT